MAMRFISADWVYPVTLPGIQHGVIVLEGDKVIGIDTRNNVAQDQLEIFPGILVPGFINTHCHLELSHLKGRMETGTGLLAF